MRCLIVKLGGIGDVAQVLPGAWELHERGYQVDWLCGNAAFGVLQCYSWVNAIRIEEGKLFSSSKIEAAGEMMRAWRLMAAQHYDLIATLSYDSRYRLLSATARANERICLSRTDRRYALLPGRSRSDEYARILLKLTDDFSLPSFEPVIPDQLPENIAPRSSSLPRIALAPGGARNALRDDPVRRWPLEFYRELAEALLAKGWTVTLTGAPEDRWVEPAFAHLPVENLIGKLKLPQLLALYEDCDASITHDTGPLHLAGLTRTLQIGLFGPTNPWAVMPRRAGVAALWGGEGMACRPCYDGRDFADCKNNQCLTRVSPARVLALLQELMKQRAEQKETPLRVLNDSSTR